MAPVNLQAAPQRQSRLLSLPAEIQLMIFELVFVRSAYGKFINKPDWRVRERKKRREAVTATEYVKRPFPGFRVSGFLVSKDFFALAARAYVRGQPADVREGYFSNLRHDNIFMLFAQDCTVDIATLRHLGKIPNLKRLTVRMSWIGFGVWALPPRRARRRQNTSDDDSSDEEFPYDNIGKRLTQELLNQQDFAEFSELNTQFQDVKGLATFHLLDDIAVVSYVPSERVIWQANLETYERFLRPMVTAPKTADSPARTPNTSEKMLFPATTAPAKTLDPVLSSALLGDRAPQHLDSAFAPLGSSFDELLLPFSFLAAPKPSRQRQSRDFGTTGDTNATHKRTRSLTSEDYPEKVSKRRKIPNATSTTSVRQSLPSQVAVDNGPETNGHAKLASSVTPAQQLPDTSVIDSPPSPVKLLAETSLSSILPQLERLLDLHDPALMAWLLAVKTKGKLRAGHV